MPDLKLWGDERISKLKNDMDRLFEALYLDFGLPSGEHLGQAAMQMTEENDKIKITLPLPGLDPEDIEVNVTEWTMSITGRKVEKFTSGHRTQSFRREIALPCRITTEEVQASYKNDVLTITLPKCRRPVRRLVRVRKS